MAEIETVQWSGLAMNAVVMTATFPTTPGSTHVSTGHLQRFWMKGNSEAGSIFLFESGTNIALGVLTAGSNVFDSSNPRIVVQTAAGADAAAGDNLYDRAIVHNPLYIVASGLTSGTGNKLGTVVAEYVRP